jgi:hypothetical protein
MGLTEPHAFIATLSYYLVLSPRALRHADRAHRSVRRSAAAGDLSAMFAPSASNSRKLRRPALEREEAGYLVQHPRQLLPMRSVPAIGEDYHPGRPLGEAGDPLRVFQ